MGEIPLNLGENGGKFPQFWGKMEKYGENIPKIGGKWGKLGEIPSNLGGIWGKWGKGVKFGGRKEEIGAIVVIFVLYFLPEWE